MGDGVLPEAWRRERPHFNKLSVHPHFKSEVKPQWMMKAEVLSSFSFSALKNPCPTFKGSLHAWELRSQSLARMGEIQPMEFNQEVGTSNGNIKTTTRYWVTSSCMCHVPTL